MSRVERELPRDRFPWVFESLLAIHEGQVRSLEQQDAPHFEEASRLDDASLLAMSFEKGGSSVLADLHLVAPLRDPAHERFAFGFGVFLQLLDDLQDVDEDLAAGHETLFTRAARRGVLDEPTARLARFIDRTLDGAFPGAAHAERVDLVRRNCRALLVGSVALRVVALHAPIPAPARRRAGRCRSVPTAACDGGPSASSKRRRPACARWTASERATPPDQDDPSRR